MAAKAGLWAPILSLFGPNSRNIRPNYLLIQRLSRAQHRSNEVVLEGVFSELRVDGVLRSSSPRRRVWLELLLEAARHVVVLVSAVAVPAFTAIELVPLPIYGGKIIVAITAIDDILALASVQIIVARPTVEDIVTGSSPDSVGAAKATYLVVAVLTIQSWM